jgi:tetratricopeptide (TPR) repeat protein
VTKHLSIFIFISSLLFINSIAQAKVKNQRAEVDSTKFIEVKFGSASWNKDPSVIENGVVLLRDGNTKKTMQVLLEETAPDSGIFSGTYSISWGGSAIKPEVYDLDQSKLASDPELKKILDDINSGKLKRKPLFYKKTETGTQVLEVFDNKDQATEALSLINIESQKGPNMDLSSVTTKEYSAAKAIMDSQELAKFSVENESRKKEIKKRVIDRFRFEQTEKLRIQNYKKEQATLPEKERQKRAEEAVQFADAGLDFYKAGEYEKAEEDFRKSYALDPTSDKYYFQYGLSLYKSKKYNSAIVVFNIVKTNKEFSNESLYYMGLSQYAFKEFEIAYSTFSELEKTKDEKLAPLATFYTGLIYYDQKTYEKALIDFQEVLDTSKDPKLDQKAENYIDMINQVLSYAKVKQKKIILSGSFGAIYDSNVLQQSDSSGDQGGASEAKSLRYILGLGVFYRPIYNKEYEFGAKIRTDYIYTQNSDATDYDPWSIQVSTPFTYKDTMFGKAHKLDLKPGYELLYLGQDASGSPKKTLKGYYLETSNTFIMKDDWFTTFSVNFRKDSYFESSDAGKDANKIVFKWSNMFFTNQAKTKGILGDFSYTTSNADDTTNSTKRYDLSGMYLTPVFNEKATFAGGLGLYRLSYESRDRDFNKTINLTLTKPLSEWVSGTVLGTYVMNDSQTASYKYDKWTLGFVFTSEYGF